MDEILDSAWLAIEAFLKQVTLLIDRLVSPLEVMGPAAVIFILAFAVVCLTRLIKRIFVTQRYQELKKDFEHWQGVREEAMKHPDPEKGKALAKNIDQAKLNKAYYDYFFEGFLNNLITNVLPILLMASYVTRVYTSETLLARFGREWVFTLSLGSFQVRASSLLWFVVSLILTFILYTVIAAKVKKKDAAPVSS